MAGLVASVAIMLILSTVAYQKWEDLVRRDDEAEMIFRAQEIVRAIVKFRRDRGGLLPEKLEELMEPSPKGQYYLRRLYDDPLVRDGKWGLLHGGPSGEIIDPAAPEQPAVAPGGLTPAQPLGEALAPAQTGIGGIANPQPVGSGEVGGLRIAGVKSLSTDKPFRVWRGLTDYAEWHFTYLDLEAPQVPGQGGAAGQGPPGATPPGGVPPRPPITTRPPGRPNSPLNNRGSSLGGSKPPKR